jgi:small-conductance mechanosensitive channel
MIDFELIHSALNNLITGSIGFLPKLLTTVLILLIGWLIARLVASIVQRLAERLHLENLLERTGVNAGFKRAEFKRTGSEIVAALLFWIIFLNFILVGLENLGLEAAIVPLRNLIAFLPRLLAALATFTVGMLLAQFLGRAAQAAMSGMGVDFHEEVGQGVNILLIIMVVIVVLEQLGIDATVLTTVFTNVLTIIVAGLALAFGLGGRDVARKLLAGYYAREQFAPGERIIVDTVEGTLEGIGTLNSELRVGDELIIVPNTRLTDTAVRVKQVKQPEEM